MTEFIRVFITCPGCYEALVPIHATSIEKLIFNVKIYGRVYQSCSRCKERFDEIIRENYHKKREELDLQDWILVDRLTDKDFYF